MSQWSITQAGKFSPPAPPQKAVRPGMSLKGKHGGASSIGPLGQHLRRPGCRAGEHMAVARLRVAPACKPAAVERGEFLQ